jgi:antitoxin component YwqK of YwqJK toxin-antitoxin module
MKKVVSVFLIVCSTVVAHTQTTDASGRKQGYWKKKDEKTGRLIYEGEFRDDKPVGKFRYYYPNDSVHSIMYFKMGSTAAYAKLFHMNGKRMAEGKYLSKEVKDSVWTYYDEAGVLLSSEKYANGKKEGISYVYFPDGTVSEERNYKNGLMDGPFKQYFDAKKVRAQGSYLKGELDGRVCYYFPNGTEAAAGYYVNGQKNGPWIYRASGGNITDKELYTNGKLADKKETEAFFSKHKTAEVKPSTGTPAQKAKPAPAKTNTK